MLGAQVGKGTAGGGGAPAAAAKARCGEDGGSGWRAGGGEHGGLYIVWAQCDSGVTTVIPPWYGTSAGAADGPGVRRAHGARTTPRRPGSRHLGQGDALGGGASGGARPQAERRWEGTRGTAVEGRPARGQRRAVHGARDVAAWARPTQINFAEQFFEKEKLHFLNKSSLTFDHESCRPNYPLSFSKRLYQQNLQETDANFECQPVLLNSRC
jgi:hypothetical protein